MSLETIRLLHVAALDVPALNIPRARGISGQASAAVDAGSIIAFVAGIDAQDQEDVLYSTQLAQRAASGVADRYKGVHDWYKEYSRVLQMTGWVLQGFAPSSQNVEEGEYEIAKAALRIVAAAATGPQNAVLVAAINALEGMADENGFITLFEHFGVNDLVGNFQIGAVAKDGDALSMRLGAFQMNMTERRKKFLFVKWREKGVSVWADAQIAMFNRAHYDGLRDEVRNKLGEDARDAIALLPLAPIN
jgi:hypothetical protein